MNSKYNYIVLGAGRQGAAAAYDLSLRGDASSVIIADVDFQRAKNTVDFVNSLSHDEKCIPEQADVRDKERIKDLFSRADSVISAVPYYFNLSLTELAIEEGVHFCDMGGNTAVVREQLKLDVQAKGNGVAVVPDTGMGPGLNITMIRYVYDKFDKAEEIIAYVGGLPKNPKPPWNYELLFNINGLTNEYHGNAFVLLDGELKEVPCFDGLEVVNLPGVGELEAAVTSGGLSTAPWTFRGKLKSLQYKTLRYPGHWEIFRAYSLLGLFSEEPVDVNGQKIIPRDFYHALLEPKLRTENPRDVGVLRIVGRGKIQGEFKTFVMELVEEYDEKLHFTAMQKLTGWHSSIVAILSAKGKIDAGVHSVENLEPSTIVSEARKRGFDFKEYFE